jgi:hypothetical protein
VGDYNSVPEVRSQPQDPDPPSSDDHQVRRFLVGATVALMFTGIVAYLITRDVIVLATTTFIGAAAASVYNYYFGRRR